MGICRLRPYIKSLAPGRNTRGRPTGSILGLILRIRSWNMTVPPQDPSADVAMTNEFPFCGLKCPALLSSRKSLHEIGMCLYDA